MTSVPEQWEERAQYDLETARAMLQSGRFLYVLFCCQQAIEKMIKGIIAKRTEKMPPRLHNLMRLVEHADIDLSQDRSRLFEQLSLYYVQSRYPDEMASLSAEVSQDMARRVLDETEATVEWLSSMI